MTKYKFYYYPKSKDVSRCIIYEQDIICYNLVFLNFLIFLLIWVHIIS